MRPQEQYDIVKWNPMESVKFWNQWNQDKIEQNFESIYIHVDLFLGVGDPSQSGS